MAFVLSIFGFFQVIVFLIHLLIQMLGVDRQQFDFLYSVFEKVHCRLPASSLIASTLYYLIFLFAFSKLIHITF